jgi:hypothetical protein
MIRSTLNLNNDDQTFGKGDTIFTVSKLRPNIIKEDLLVKKREGEEKDKKIPLKSIYEN